MDSVVQLPRVRLRVSNGNDDARVDSALYELRGVPFGREGEDAYPALGVLLPLLELLPVGRADMLFWMGAARPVFGRNAGTFDMDADCGIGGKAGLDGRRRVPFESTCACVRGSL